MQLQDLFIPLEKLSEEELKEKLRAIRHNRTVERPAAKARAKKTASKGRVTAINKLQSLLAGMSDEDKAKLILELGESND